MTKTTAVNGTFDVLHRGHLALIEYARSQAGYLLVCIDSDRRVKELKGNDRPVNNQFERKHLLENIKGVDKVLVFDSDDQLRNIYYLYQPSTLVVGKEYQGRLVIGSEYCDRVDYFERIDGYSTTEKVQSIIDR